MRWGIPDGQRIPIINLQHSGNAIMVIVSYFYSKNIQSSEGNNLITMITASKKFKLVLRNIDKKVVSQSSSPWQGLLLCGWRSGMDYFCSNNSHNLRKNECVGKKIQLVLKTIYKKDYPKIPGQDKVSFIVLVFRGFFQLFLLKNSHNSGKNGRIKKY